MNARVLGATGYEPRPDDPARRALFDIKRDLGTRLGVLEDAKPGEPNGFEDRSDCTLSFDNSTRVLTLTGDYTFFCRGKKFTKTTDSFTIPDVEGSHYVYYDANGILQEYTAFDPALIGQDTFVAFIYWDATNNEAIPWVLCEQHESAMSSITHSYLHNTRGAAYDSGILPAAISIDGAGSSNDNARFSTTAGETWDEDILHTIVAHTSTAAIPWLYRSGATGVWRMDDGSEYLVRKGTNRAYWNEYTGATWQLTEAGQLNYVLAHVFAIPGVNETSGGVVIVAGQAVYSTVVLARQGAETELASLRLDGLPSPEFVAVATFIIQTSTTYSNAVASRTVSTDDGGQYIDWRNVLGTASSGSSGLTTTAWTAVTFAGTWANYGSGYQGMEYRKVGDMVQLRGVIAGGTSGTTVCTLPAGFRPPAQTQTGMRAGTGANSAGLMDVNTNGVVIVYSEGATTACSVDFQFSVST
jgi:hypothetical protein